MLDPSIELLPRVIHRHTSLVDTAIIYPAEEPRYRELAEMIAKAIIARGGNTPQCVADTTLIPERSTPLPDKYRSKSLVVLGSLNTNRTLQPLYANFLCATDAGYPGGDGYDLRTIVNPYGTGSNVILVGGSTLRGVERATDSLLAQISQTEETTALSYLFKVELEPSLAADLFAWPLSQLDDIIDYDEMRKRGLMFLTEPIRVIGGYTLIWSVTGDERYAAAAVEALRQLNAAMPNGYGDWHYQAERFLRSYPLLVAGGMLNDEDIAETDRRLLLTALGNQDEWWRVKVGHPPLGHRHQGKGTHEFLLLARYLRDQTNPTPKLRALCDRWIQECYNFLDALATARLDDQDDESSLNNLATLYRYALGQERHDFFTSGNARLVAERCLALHDNNGNGCGQGGYGESQGMYLQQEATVQAACSSFYYGDGQLKWILKAMPNLEIPQRNSFLRIHPVFIHKFQTGPELTPVAPAETENVSCLPVTDHQFAISNNPPEHVTQEGHMVNASETWQLPEGIGLNTLPQERGFDKLVLRRGYECSDAYLIMQGYQGGFRWQGHMQAANCIVRFFQHSHVWLVQNTSRHSYYDKNGLLISDGANDGPMPPIAERVAIADFDSVALTSTKVNDYHHTDWTRHLFWSKPGDGFFVIIDRVSFKADGPYSLTCSWRTPGHAELEGRRWHSDQGAHRFTVLSSSTVASTCEVDTDQGGCDPYVLRQRLSGEHQKGDTESFQNLLIVRALEDEETYDLQRLDANSALVRRDGAPVAWCGADIHPDFAWLPHAKANATSVWVDTHSLALSGLTALQLPGLALRCESPINVSIDLTKSTLILKTDIVGPVEIILDDEIRKLTADIPLSLEFAPEIGPSLVNAITAWFETMTEIESPEALPTALPESPDHLRSAWAFDSKSRTPEIVRDLRITADPLPLNGSPDEMIDPVMPDGYSREMWIQWPETEHYHISLTLPKPRLLSALNILGDCIDDPTFRTFHSLPAGITVECELEDGSLQSHQVEPLPDRRYKRYRDGQNSLAAHAASIDEKVRALHIRLPAPQDGNPFVLHRLEVLSDQKVAPEIEHWTTADLDGDGQIQIILTNAQQELIVIDAEGQERWRKKLSMPITHISAQAINPEGPPILCVGMLGGSLHQYDPQGNVLQQWAVAEEFLKRTDCLQGWFNATHDINIWKRDDDGRACLVLGGYGILVFLDADGDVVGHSFVDGPWAFDILVAPESHPDRGDIYTRCGWNHGIMYYPAVPGDGPSGEVYHLGGFNQPMFRMLKRVIPFLNGRSLAAEWIDTIDGPKTNLFFASELGCGVLSTTKKDWHWKLEGGMSLNTAALGKLKDQPVALIGGMDGFVAAVDLSDGQVTRRQHVGSPVIGITPLESGALVVATQTEIQFLNQNWEHLHTLSRQVKRVLTVSANRLLVCHEDMTLELLELRTD